MAEDWELKQLERRVDSLEKGLERERVRAQEERDTAREEKVRRRNLRWNLSMVALWTVYVAAITTCIVLAATGHLHHH
ncbi:MAG TPA: hypothetical protein VIJ21_10595 [Solirubrobacterales bacterium]